MLMIRPLFARAICRGGAACSRAGALKALAVAQGSAGVERALEVDGKHAVEVLLGHLQQQLVAGDARVVDEDVDAAEVLADPAEGFLDERKIGHVAFVGRGADAEGLRFGDRFGRALVRAGVHDGDVGAVLGERDRDGRADAARTAGDDRRFAFEKHKLLSFPFFFVVRLRRLHAERKRLGVLHVEDLRLGQNAPD